ncbi:hypothetical protein K439DRAFT_1661642 [Ramaria rubella]|nr:hypothetical protein K439DRAFT_1661642 [Ramaria rubella]
MPRTKGTRNRAGHKAGGARKGAGRKPRQVLDGVHPPSVADDEAMDEMGGDYEDEHPSRPEGQDRVESVDTTFADSLIDTEHIHSSFRPYLLHNVHPVVALTPGSASHLSDATSHPQSSQVVWHSVLQDVQQMEYTNTSSLSMSIPMPLAYSTQSLTQLATPFEPDSSPISSQHESSEVHRAVRPSTSSISQASAYDNIESSPKFPRDFPLSDPEQHQELPGNVPHASFPVDQPCGTTPPPQLPPPSSETVTHRFPLVHIAPAPPSQQQRTWMFPYPIPAIMGEPVQHLDIHAQSSAPKRRRRRCVVCLQQGKEEASYECPGRGDRTRCPASRRPGANNGKLAPKSSQKRAPPRAKDPISSDASTSLSESTTSPSPTTDAPCTIKPHSHQPTSHRAATQTMFVEPRPLYPNMVGSLPYVPLISYGHSMHMHAGQQLVIAPGDNAKRRSRRCMVCVASGKDGTHCPGRGNRALCLDYEAINDQEPDFIER